jgi:hypothetical protein
MYGINQMGFHHTNLDAQAKEGNSMSFHGAVSEYLKNVSEKPARLFGIRYSEYLYSKHYGVRPNPRPSPSTPSQRLVQLEIKRLFQEHEPKKAA